MNIHHNNLENYFGIFTIGTYSENPRKFSIEKTTTDLGTRIGKLIAFVFGNVVSLILYIVLLTQRANLQKNISKLDRVARRENIMTALANESQLKSLATETSCCYNNSQFLIDTDRISILPIPTNRSDYFLNVHADTDAYNYLRSLSDPIGSYTAMVNTTLAEAKIIYDRLDIKVNSIPIKNRASNLDFAIFKMFETLEACTKTVESFEKCSINHSYLGVAKYYNDISTNCKTLLENLIEFRQRPKM